MNLLLNSFLKLQLTFSFYQTVRKRQNSAAVGFIFRYMWPRNNIFNVLKLITLFFPLCIKLIGHYLKLHSY